MNEYTERGFIISTVLPKRCDPGELGQTVNAVGARVADALLQTWTNYPDGYYVNIKVTMEVSK